MHRMCDNKSGTVSSFDQIYVLFDKDYNNPLLDPPVLGPDIDHMVDVYTIGRSSVTSLALLVLHRSRAD